MKSYKEIMAEASKEARRELKDALALCTEEQNHMFKLMYAGGDMELTYAETVNRMPEEQIDWAMQQVQRTLDIIAAARCRG